MNPDVFELGCNYWPRRRAMYMWRDVDLGEVRDELLQIRQLGFDVVRIFAPLLPARSRPRSPAPAGACSCRSSGSAPRRPGVLDVRSKMTSSERLGGSTSLRRRRPRHTTERSSSGSFRVAQQVPMPGATPTMTRCSGIGRRSTVPYESGRSAWSAVTARSNLQPAVFRSFAGRSCAAKPVAIAAGSADEYYSEPARHFAELYSRYP